jgi:hypothetical protein
MLSPHPPHTTRKIFNQVVEGTWKGGRKLNNLIHLLTSLMSEEGSLNMSQIMEHNERDFVSLRIFE